MQTIWKYRMTVRNVPLELGIPNPGKILTVQTRHGEIRMWVLVNPEAVRRKRQFIVIETGQEIPSKGVYVGTAQVFGGDFVGHIFELE